MNTSTSSPELIDLAGLPGAEFVTEGLKDIAERRVSVPALLLEIAAPRLRGVGIPVPEFLPQPFDAEIRLYRLLGAEHGSEAYSQYNALLRRLVSLSRAAEGRFSRLASR
jgi:hypothetical protein